jgi:hypothetical protein
MRRATFFCLLLLLSLNLAPIEARSSLPGSSLPQATITVSGTVTGPSGPVTDVWIGVGSPQDWREATTNSSGFYSLSIETGGQLWFNVRPSLATRLAQANHWRGDVTASITQDFTLPDGYLLDLGLLQGGVALAEPLRLDVQPLVNHLPGEWWYSLDWDDATHRYRAVLPYDVYYVTAQDPPAGTYDTTQAFDLRSADLAVDMPLSSTYVHPIPYDPPVASLIAIGPPDGLGEASVSGAPGSVLPLAQVLLVNLNSGHQAQAISTADGSFSARIYAPPGSAVMVKHGPASTRWNDLEMGVAEMVNPFPGTTIIVPHTHAGSSTALPFAAAGAIDLHTDDPSTTRNYVGSAWALAGTAGPVAVDGEWERVLDGTYDGAAVPGLYLGGMNWTHPALGDLDADGDLDLLVGERSGGLVLYRNHGSAGMPAWQFESADYAGVATEWWAYPTLAEVTGDGVFDLFVGAGNGRLLVYYNQGTTAAPAWPASPDVTLPAGTNAAPALADLDNDGDLDLLAGHEGGTLYHWKNTGTTANPAWTLQTSSYGGISEPDQSLQPSFVDLDGDADLDLLIGRNGDLVWYRRDGLPASPTWTRMTDGYMGFGGSSAVSPGLGDWDGDGDRDLVTGEHWGVLRFFRNDGPPTWAEQSFEFPFDLAGDSAPALADWDDDGDLDMLMGQVWGQVHQYTNAGTAAEPDWQPGGELLTLPWINHPHAFPALADIDGDLDPDLFVGEGGWQGPGAGGNIHYYENLGTPSIPDWTLVTDAWLGLDVGGWSTPAFADIDDDGDLDLFLGDEAGTLTFVQNTGTPTAPAWAAPVQPYADLHLGAFSAPAFFDLDQDGDLDMLVGLQGGSLAYVRNAGTPGSPTWELVSTQIPGIDIGDNAAPAAADVDGDGHPDLLLGDGDGGLNLYLYLGPGTQPAPGEIYAPGDLIRIEGTLRLYSPAITAGIDPENITVHGWPHLKMLFNGDGQAVAANNYFMSTLLTPTGFPIQGGGGPSLGLEAHLAPESLRYAGDQTVEGDMEVTLSLPSDLPPGIYRPFVWLDISGVPTSTQWLAANVTFYTSYPQEAALPPITVGQVDHAPRLIWRLMMDDFVEGTRGAGARQDVGKFELASQITSQGAAFHVPPVDARTGQAVPYRLEPFLPMISYTDRRIPGPPVIPFDLPVGQMCVTVQKPDGSQVNLGCEAAAQSFNRTKTTRDGLDLNGGTVQLDDVYSLKAASDRFRVTFEQYGHHVVTMTGTIDDLWGNSYEGGGTYDVWVAQPLDIDPGVLPGTPLAVGDVFNPALQLSPRVPADVTLTLTLYPNSNPAQAQATTVSGIANRFGYFGTPDMPSSISLASPGEYRVDLTAAYTAPDGTLYMGAMTWGGVVMTPPAQATLIAHGRRGLDSLQYIPNHWFVSSRDLIIPPGVVSHSYNPYFNGDVLWTRMSDGPWGGDSLLIGGSVQDTVGVIQAAIEARYARMHPELAAPGTFAERVAVGELPLFISTRSGRPPALDPGDMDQLAYSYRSSQRPGVRVREVVSQDNQNGGYWRLDTLYDDQLSVGVLGDLPNDFKFQYVGAVYRDLETGHNEYLGQGTGWFFIPDDDPTGSRAMPPFAGEGNGGWTTEGGPLLTLKGQDVHIFILPTGVQPGAVLQVGDTFRFAGHVMPTLNSQVTATVTAPGGATHQVDGQANQVGYFYDPDDDFVVDEPGLWSVDVLVWHDGLCSGGETMPPYPSGDVLGSENGRYWFYVVPGDSPRLSVSSPVPGFLSFEGEVAPITISGALPGGLGDVAVDYTVHMPGFILAHGQATIDGSTYQITFDPAALQQDFPNLDLMGRDSGSRPGLADTISIGLLLQGQDERSTIYAANTVTLQGDQVFVEETPPGPNHEIYLPLVVKGG